MLFAGMWEFLQCILQVSGFLELQLGYCNVFVKKG